MENQETGSNVCTLFEGNYHFGLGALVNSLYCNGFRGVIWAGYRGKLPPWATALKQAGEYKEFRVAEGCVLRFLPLDTSMHMTNYKPTFMRQVFDHPEFRGRALFYFDPDIVVKCHWAFFEQWVARGICLCQDITNAAMPFNHPLRLAWKEFAEKCGHKYQRDMNQYFNAGFIGISRSQEAALVIWQQLLKEMEESGADFSSFMPGNRSKTFYIPDQDALNLMTMLCDEPLSTIGPEGMDFIPGGFTMSHAVGAPKPWNKKMVRSALRGRAPSIADKGYWKNTQSPICLYDAQSFFWQKFDVRCAAAIGRFMRTSW